MSNAVSKNGDSGKRYDLRERTAAFGEKEVRFAQSIPRNPVTVPLISQFVNAGTSVCANFAEADGAFSRKDFFHKVSICRKEAKETAYWLRMIRTAAPEKALATRALFQEATELTLIFSSILRQQSAPARVLTT